MKLASSAINEEPLSLHALKAYSSFLKEFEHNNFNGRLKKARSFIRTYPDLAQWQKLNLLDRIGSNKPRRGISFITFNARPYLYFLAQQQCIVLDWGWIIGIQTHVLPVQKLPLSVQDFSLQLVEKMRALGYKESTLEKIERAIRYFFIRYGDSVVNVGETELEEFSQALEDFHGSTDAIIIHGSAERLHSFISGLKMMLFVFKTALYQNHRIPKPPKRKIHQPTRLQVKPAMLQYIEKYVQARLALHTRPTTVGKIRNAGNHLADWLYINHPSVESFVELTREQVLAYSAFLVSSGVNVETQLTRLSSLSVMFHDTTAWGWPEAPARPLIGSRDLPKRPNRIPRFIPAEELDRIMIAIKPWNVRTNAQR